MSTKKNKHTREKRKKTFGVAQAKATVENALQHDTLTLKTRTSIAL